MNSLNQLTEGVRRFHRDVWANERELFDRLSQGQDPNVLFVTCSDSRVDPNLITQTKPGDLFVIRNAGNIVPAYGPGTAGGGEAATVEYAVTQLHVTDVIVCGHTKCGAMTGLLALEDDPNALAGMPGVAAWLQNAEATRAVVRTMADSGDKVRTAVERNVLVQLANLRTHPCVAAAVAEGKLTLHGWVYGLEDGDVYAYHPATDAFARLDD